MVLNIIRTLNWMDKFRDYKASQTKPMFGFDFTYKVLFFLISVIVTMMVSTLLGLLYTLLWVLPIIELDIFLYLFFTSSFYVSLFLFIVINGLTLINETILKLTIITR